MCRTFNGHSESRLTPDLDAAVHLMTNGASPSPRLKACNDSKRRRRSRPDSWVLVGIITPWPHLSFVGVPVVFTTRKGTDHGGSVPQADSGYFVVWLILGPRLAVGRYLTLKLSVETRFPGCQRGPDTELVCLSRKAKPRPGNTRPQWAGQVSRGVDWAFQCVLVLIHTC